MHPEAAFSSEEAARLVASSGNARLREQRIRRFHVHEMHSPRCTGASRLLGASACVISRLDQENGSLSRFEMHIFAYCMQDSAVCGGVPATGGG
jgi:hypothetical protein